jgi:hypothetical protein
MQLLAEGEVAPCVTFAELEKRRTRLATALPDNSVAIVPSAPKRYVTGVIPYPYRQDADFYWLTGITQPGVAVLHKRRRAGVPLQSIFNSHGPYLCFWRLADVGVGLVCCGVCIMKRQKLHTCMNA